MRILVYDVAASNRGALSVLNDFYQQVVEYGSDVEWHFVISTPELKEYENIHIHRYPWIKNSPVNRIFFDTFVIQKLIKRLKIDKVLSLQNVCIKRCRIPQMISLHNALAFHKCDSHVLCGTLSILKQRYINKNILSSLRKAQTIFVPNEWIYNSCAAVKGVKRSKIQLIKPHMVLPEISNKSNTGIQGRTTTFYYPANAEPYKRHDLIYKACRILNDEGFTSHNVVFTANGNENPYIDKIRKSCIDDNLPIVFHGNMSREEVYQYYFRSILLFPSEIETDALPIIEAMMCNAFIIATRSDFAECILKDYSNSVLVPLGEDIALAKAMREVLSDKYTIEINDNTIAAIGQKDGLVKAVIRS